MVHFSLIGLTLVISIVNAVPSKQCFRAAVLDQTRQTVEFNNVAENLKANLKLYEKAAQVVKENKGDIIVFPEQGLIYNYTDRADLAKYAEVITVTSNPCQSGEGTLKQLSCLAKNNRIFVAAHLYEREDKSLYSVAVLFDRAGIVLAKYRKYHLFDESSAIDMPDKPEAITVDTELGTLGLMVGFDIVYEQPGKDLVEKGATIIYPTFWLNEAPFWTASQLAYSFSRKNNVNFVAANIHDPLNKSRESGVYSTTGEYAVAAYTNDIKSRVLLANIATQPWKVSCKLSSSVIEIPGVVELPKFDSEDFFYDTYTQDVENVVPGSQHSLSIIDLTSGKAQGDIGHNGKGLCQVEFEIDPSTTGTMITQFEEYNIWSGAQVRKVPNTLSEEYCTVIECESDFNCSQIWTSQGIGTRFHYLHVTAEFSSDAVVYPVAVGANHLPIHAKEYELFVSKGKPGSKSDKKLYEIRVGHKGNTEKIPIYALGFYARRYSQDPVKYNPNIVPYPVWNYID